MHSLVHGVLNFYLFFIFNKLCLSKNNSGHFPGIVKYIGTLSLCKQLMKDLANQIQSSQFKNSWLKTYNFTLPLSFNLALVHQEDVFKKAKNRPSNDLAAAKDSSKKALQ